MPRIATLFLLLILTCLSIAEEPTSSFSYQGKITGSPLPAMPYTTAPVFTKLTFDQPVTLTKAPGTHRLFLVELKGKIFSLSGVHEDSKADLVANLEGAVAPFKQVYGLAFHPNFAQNRICFICYTDGAKTPNGEKLSRFRMTTDDPPQLIIESEEILLSWLSGGHEGGCLKFGPDGYLYISTGDAGPAFPPDPKEAGQDLTNLLSAILRIDVDNRDKNLPYAIPLDNPFLNLPGARGEIWAYGFRNPWKISFDSENGDLWCGDVGWELWEMIHHVKRGDNFGWSLVEGPHDVHLERKRGPTPITKSAAVHPHTEARSITGGHVYRGTKMPELEGAYIYGDHVTGKIWAVRNEGNHYSKPQEIANTRSKIICFGTDHQGEIYVVGYDGEIHQLTRNEAIEQNQSFPKSLSDTGLFSSLRNHSYASGVYGYEIVAEPWMDGAFAKRFIAFPPNSKRIGIYEKGSGWSNWAGQHKGSWKFPSDTVLGKTILIPTSPIDAAPFRVETQILHFDGNTWQPYSYVWNEAQTDALLLDRSPSHVSVEIAGATRRWNLFHRTECMICHTSNAGMVLGFKPEQLARKIHRVFTSESNSSNSGVMPISQEIDQLQYLNSLHLFETPLNPKRPKKLVHPHDATAELGLRARSYLHVNCAHCHRRGGGGAAPMDVRFDRPLEKTQLIDVRPTQGTFGIHSAKVVAPGDPYRSVMFFRLLKLGRGRMPYFGTELIDRSGIRLIHDWITSMAPGGEAKFSSDRTNQIDALAAMDDSQLSAFMANTENSLFIAHAIHGGQIDDATQNRILEVATADSEPMIRDLFERFFPEEQRTHRLGTEIDANSLLAMRGDADQGRRLFASELVSCKNCHSVIAGKTSVGPNLATIKESTPTKILKSILDPSRSIDSQYVTHLIETAEGKVITGIIKSKDAQSIVIVNAKNQEIKITTDDVEFMTQHQKSLMPDRLLSQLTAKQAADLLAYLVSLNKQ